MKSLLLLFATTLLLSAPLAAQEDHPILKQDHHSSFELHGDPSPEIIQNAIIKAAIGRRWTIVKKEDGLVVVNLVHRKHDSTLYFTYEDSKVTIHSDSYLIDKNGERRKPKDPDGWIENLKKDIRVFVDRELYLSE